MIIKGDPDYLSHSSKYKGGFTKDGKNTSAYNHDYYMKNKEKWKDNAENKDDDIIDDVKDAIGDLLGYGYKENAKNYTLAANSKEGKTTGKSQIYENKALDEAKRYRWSTAHQIDSVRDLVNAVRGKKTNYAKSVVEMISPETWRNNKKDREYNYAGRQGRGTSKVNKQHSTQLQPKPSSRVRKKVKGKSATPTAAAIKKRKLGRKPVGSRIVYKEK